MNVPLRLLFAALPVAFAASPAWANGPRITVAAPAEERAAQLASFTLPEGSPARPVLVAADGTRWPLQHEGDGRVTFLISSQRAGEALVFTLTEGPEAVADGVEAGEAGGDLQLRAAGRLAFAYRMDKDVLPRADIAEHYKRAGYLHPVLTPSGRLVTGDYHPRREHHHGLWSAWTNTRLQGRKPDFWNVHAKTGGVEFAGLDATWGGPVHGGFTARHTFVDRSGDRPVPALHEFWTVRTYPLADATIVDLLITQVCGTNDPLILPEYRYGGMGYRGNSAWLGRDLPKVLTSEGETDRVKAHTQKVRWLHLGGPVDGAWAGLAMMDHPGNFRSPQPVRVGEAEPFFCLSPSQGGDWSIEPGKPYVARYRFVAMDGEPDAKRLDAFWAGHATEAVVTVGSR